MSKDPLFEPITIHGLEIRNRIFMPAMHLNMAKNYFVTDRIVAFYDERAKGGAGFITVGFATVDEYSGPPGHIGAHKDEFIKGLSELASAIKRHGARAAVQLNHAGRYNLSVFLNGRQPVAPSPIPSRLTKETPREMTLEEIRTTITSFANAARRVREAGFDAVEILSGTGYLISEFLSPLTNQRQDEYGGSLENRMRFGIEVVQAVRRTVGSDFPILVRVNGNDMMPGGITRQELTEYVGRLIKAGANAINVNVGWHEARVPQIVAEVPRGAYAYLARYFKEIFHVPVISGHRINDPHIARELIGNHLCDMVAMGRALIADPFLPEKAKDGREHEIIHCVGCAQGCFDNLFKMRSVECLCNPRAGYERERVIERVLKPKKVMIIGGGAAGMSAAIASHDRGHSVTIYEKSSRLGGQLLLAGAPPGREEFLQLASDLVEQVSLRGISVILNRTVTEDILKREKPDVVILATGAEPSKLPIPGIDNEKVLHAWEVLGGKRWTGKRVVIIGGGAVGIETALYLAEKGTIDAASLKFLLIHQVKDTELILQMATRGTKDITIVEMLPEIGKDIGLSTRWCLMQDIQMHGVRVVTSAKVIEINAQGVIVETPEGRKVLEADTIVVATGSKPCRDLEEVLKKLEIPYHVVGDALKIGKAFDAIHEGSKVGMAI
ncbi:MAG: FAD-dependent oxidoreductase [Syntrophobacterales bacterium]|nr:FAD-dependent oxidoreductase [Syntrophobacterales bacterium]